MIGFSLNEWKGGDLDAREMKVGMCLFEAEEMAIAYEGSS
jgi:hypothetical protein